MRSERQSQGCMCPKHMRVLHERDEWKEKYEREHAKVARLEEQLGKVRRTALERPFGEHTPSIRNLCRRNRLR